MLRFAVCLCLLAIPALAQQYDLLLKGGHLIDAKNNIDGIMDVAVSKGVIAAVAKEIPPTQARKVVRLTGLYITPGLIDTHVHVYTGTGLKGVLTGDSSVYPDGFSFRTGVTTMADAGTAGWRNFPDFRQRVIDRARTRILAFINILGGGMGITSEQDPNDMNAEATAAMAKQHADIVVGFKVAHFAGQGWPDIDGAIKAGELCKLPVMVDFGYIRDERNLKNLMETKLRKGDIYTHCYSSHREEMLDGKLNQAMWNGRKRGVLFDVGHGGGSFYWNVAVPAIQQGFLPDVISTDLHTGSMNSGMKDLSNVMSKHLNMGLTLNQVVTMTTWNAAKELGRTDIGHLTPGVEADITVLRVRTGTFGFIDSAGARMSGTKLLVPELTVRKGAVVWDLNGTAARDWKTFPYRKRDAPAAAAKK
ncbi:MAG TPA: amidohydrolase/deacetylase family metallohydrolase [Bryobacteraceae bacterium]|nr:amidohydrolase/deacetylase family metallohydrolase [Bryobacteraceae bacterium]